MARLWSLVDVLAAFCLIVLLEYRSCGTERVCYLSTEHPHVTYYNKKYFKFVNVTSRRLGRRDRFYYVNIHLETVHEINNTLKWDFYFYEFLTNRYKPTFVEMHFRTCDLILKDKFFGPPLKRELKKCPLPAGVYHMYNMSVPIENIPTGFPFTKGRIYANATHELIKELVTTAYIDIELKYYKIKK